MSKVLKIVRGYTKLAQFLHECDHDSSGDLLIVREIPNQKDIPSPYSYSPDWSIYRWKGQEIFIREDSHRVYKVYEAPLD